MEVREFDDIDLIFLILLFCTMAGVGLWFVVEAFHSLLVFFTAIISITGEM
jgi:hypothetical protein